MSWSLFAISVGTAFLAWLALVILFTPRIDYHAATALEPDGREFLHVVQSTCQSPLHGSNAVCIFTNGEQFYPAMRAALQTAQATINMEAYIFAPGAAADLLIDVMVERARAGVEVRLVLDSIGSARMGGRTARRLRDAGCRVEFYQPIRWYRLHRLNNRTHRELLVVDGRVAFTGGAGVADWWYLPDGRRPPWRDTMVRLEGPIVAALQGAFAENWLECCGEILTSPRHWPTIAAAGTTEAMLVKSSPSDRATSSRVVFQLLVESAVRHIDISTPYFLPDRSFRRALTAAVKRGVQVRAVVPGRVTDQRLVRLASRRMYRELLEGGVRLYEYRPTMTHVKALMIDDLWAVVGTTNVDNRSFEHNDEVNVAFREPLVTHRLREDFEADILASDEVTLDVWHRRSPFEKLVGPVCWILERQQ